MDNEEWDESEPDTFRGKCERCERETLVKMVVDPFFNEGINDDGTPYASCLPCLETRRGDV